MYSQKSVRVAILDLYEGQANQGMRCIRELLSEYVRSHDLHLELDEFEVRLGKNLPDLSYDIYISSGGPGSPLASEGSEWERLWFQWVQNLEEYNSHPANAIKKHVFFVCHSFQIACRYFKVARVTKRKSTAFGVFPVHMQPGGKDEPIFAGLHDPFYA